jgi:hypothetical protein
VDKFKEIKYEIKKLSECLNCLEKAYKCLVDVDDTDEIYIEIVEIAEKANDVKMKKEIELEGM